MEESVSLDPDIRVEGARLVVTSRIRFRLAPESRGLVMQMRAAGTAQELWNSRNFKHNELRAIHERGTVWPLDDEYNEAVMECAFDGPLSDGQMVKYVHDLNVQSQLRVLNQSHGPAAIIPRSEWA